MFRRFVVASVMAAVVAFAADWSDFAVEPDEVFLEGKLYYEISSAKELAWFSKTVAEGETQVNAILKNDIVLWDSVSGDTNYWTPIGLSQNLAYEGTFDGNGKTIIGARSENALEKVDSVYNGFFRFVGAGAIVKNLTIRDFVITANHLGSDTLMTLENFTKYTPKFYSIVGGIAGVNWGVIDSVNVIASAALAKGSTSTKTSTESSKVLVNGYLMYYFVGGVAGLNYGLVSNARVDSLALPPHASNVVMYMGGVVGANKANVSNSINESDFIEDVPSMLGGICGLNEGTLEYVKMTGDMETYDGMVGGIVADNRGAVAWAQYTGSIGYTWAGQGASLGGIAALNSGTISKCFYGMEDSERKLIQTNLGDNGFGISPEAYAGGIVARQSKGGSIDECGVRATSIGISTKSEKSGSIYTGGLVGIDSGYVDNSFVAINYLSGKGNKNPLYNIVLVDGSHHYNYYDSVLLQTDVPRDTSGIDKSLMKSPKFTWLLNTKFRQEGNKGVWCNGGAYPLLAVDGRRPSYSVARYVNGMPFDTVYTDCDGHAVWGDSIPDPSSGKALKNWQFKNGDKMVDVAADNVFTRDTSVYALLENIEGLFFTVTFKDYNDTILQVFNDVGYGRTPAYSGTPLFRDSAETKYAYKFIGWTPEISPVYGNQTYKAVYDSTVRYRTVCFNLNESYFKCTQVYYGQVGVECPENPTQESDELYDYTFESWSLDCKTLVVKSDTSVFAKYTAHRKGSSSSSENDVESSSSTVGIRMVANSVPLRYSVTANQLHLEGLELNKAVALFDVQGNLVKREVVSTERMSIPLSRGGMYILRYNGKSLKIFVP